MNIIHTNMKNVKRKIAMFALTLFALLGYQSELDAQCLPPYVISSSTCANSPIQFKVDAVGYSNLQFDFAGTVIANDPSPTFNFPTPGTYTVTVTYTDAAGNPCTQSISVVILPPPDLDVTILTPTVQCFQGNRFTLFDNSKAAPGSNIKRVKYVAAGLQIEQNDPTMPFSFDFSTADPAGGFYSIDVEIEDANGCIVVVTLQDAVEVKPSLGLSFTSTRPQGCDSVTMVITNNSLIPLSEIASFEWDFGDGNTNTTNWGPTVTHKYKTQGPSNGQFRSCLKVTDNFGCTETFCFDASATNLILQAEIVPNKDSTCFAESEVAFDIVPGIPPGASAFLWVFGDPDTGPLNVDNRNPVSTTHDFSKVGPFLINYNYVHPICGVRQLSKQIQILGPASVIPGPGIPINQRYQCRSEDTVFFPNESGFFHNDRNFGDDALSYFDDTLNMWIYAFDTASQTLIDEDLYLPNRGKDCVFRLWNFDDDYAPRCTTDSRPVYPQRAMFNNLHMAPDAVTGLFPKNTYDAAGNWINCRFSLDSLPKHMYADWEDIFMDSFYLQGQTFPKTIFVKENETFDYNGTQLTDGCFRIQVDTSDFEAYREQFYLQIPRCYNVRLYHGDTCHDFECEHEAVTQIAIMKPRASGMQRRGRFCFGGPPNYGVTFMLEATQPGCTSSEAYLNPDTALNPNDWRAYFPGGETGEFSGPAPIMPYADAGPYPNELFFAYSNPGFLKDTLRGYANVGLRVANGTGSNRCEDTAYYPNFIKFPVIDSEVEIVIPDPVPGFTNVYKVCRLDSLVMRVTTTNKTVPFDVDQVSYIFQRIAPADNELGGRFPFYSYVIFENYEWFKPMVDTDGTEYLENSLTKTVVRTYGTNTVELEKQTFVIGKVTEWEAEADISQVREILDRAFESLGFIMSELSPADIADIISIGCIDTTGLGQFIQFYINPIERESYHFRDTSIFGLDPYDDPNDYTKNAYTFIAEENGIFNFNFQVRSRIGGCIAQRGHRVIVGFYNQLTVSDSIICKETDIDGEPFFRYWHIDPDNNTSQPVWMDPVDYWGQREGEAGQLNKEGLTKWDWDDADDDENNMQTIFGSQPYGTVSYSPLIIGGTGAGKIYYQDSGIYQLRLRAQDSTGCEDTLRQNIYVTRLFADFGFIDTLVACVNIVTFLDSTVLIDPCPDRIGRPCDEIIEWFIDWGDGKRPDLFNRATYPPLLGFNIGHNYTRADTFNVKLRVKTKLGCEDSITKVLIIAGPQPAFISDKLEICASEPITFYNLSRRITPSSTWVWRFGDGVARSETFTTYEDSFLYIYNTPGLYEVYLTMFDSVAGRYCGLTYPDTVGGSQPKYEIVVLPLNPIEISADRDTICPGETVTFTASGDPDYAGYFWNFDAENGNMQEVETTTTTTTSHTYTDPGVYMVVLRGLPDPNLNMCPASDTLYIYVDSVKADFDIDSTKAPVFCFTNKSVNAVKSSWGFFHTTDITTGGEEFKQDEETADPDCRNYFDRLGTWFVCLVVENGGGCTDTICKELTFNKLVQIPNVFTPAKDGSGDGRNDFFDIPIIGHDSYDLVIRNRWGDIVFKSDDSEYDWNGKVNNTGADCPDGTYIYMFRYKFSGTDKVEDVSGIIQLIREK